MRDFGRHLSPSPGFRRVLVVVAGFESFSDSGCYSAVFGVPVVMDAVVLIPLRLATATTTGRFGCRPSLVTDTIEVLVVEWIAHALRRGWWRTQTVTS